MVDCFQRAEAWRARNDRQTRHEVQVFEHLYRYSIYMVGGETQIANSKLLTPLTLTSFIMDNKIHLLAGSKSLDSKLLAKGRHDKQEICHSVPKCTIYTCILYIVAYRFYKCFSSQ